MTFTPVRKLEVWRTLSDSQQVLVGLLAQNRQGVFFQYDASYLKHNANLSPFTLKQDGELQSAPQQPHNGLQGVFADSLPDGWGLLLMDRMFRQHAILPANVTAMDRLMFIGDSAMGALSYRPASPLSPQSEPHELDLSALGLQAQALFDGQTDVLLEALVTAGSSGGARPKAQVYFANNDFTTCRAKPNKGDEAWLVKFTSRNLALGHEEGLCEAVYLNLAEQSGLEVPTWKLLPAPQRSGASHWLAIKRFDRLAHADGRLGHLHMHSACGLLDADFRSPSLDYDDLIKASSMLCKSPQAGQIQFRRAMFNLFAANQDDHSKNWSFLQSDDGTWSLAPFYDVTFSPNPFGEQATAFGGYGKQPPLKTIQQLAATANFSQWSQAKQVLDEVVNSLSDFSAQAKALGVKKGTIVLIEQQLNHTYQTNKHLLK